MDKILDAPKCPLCGKFIADGYIATGGQSARRFVYRMDLVEQICLACDIEIGPDQTRLDALCLCQDADKMIEEYYQQRGCPLVVEEVERVSGGKGDVK